MESGDMMMPSMPEADAAQQRREWAELALAGIDAVRGGTFRGFELEPLEGSDEDMVTITPANVDLVSEMVHLRYGEEFPDLFEDLSAEV